MELTLGDARIRGVRRQQSSPVAIARHRPILNEFRRYQRAELGASGDLQCRQALPDTALSGGWPPSLSASSQSLSLRFTSLGPLSSPKRARPRRSEKLPLRFGAVPGARSPAIHRLRRACRERMGRPAHPSVCGPASCRNCGRSGRDRAFPSGSSDSASHSDCDGLQRFCDAVRLLARAGDRRHLPPGRDREQP